MVASRERAVGGVKSGLIDGGQEVTWEARHFGVRWRMTSRITAFDRPRRFVDEMIEGPFGSFCHDHQFQEHGDGTLMTDVLEFRTRPAPVRPIGDPLAKAYLRRLMTIRNATIKRRAEHG
jgi:ligand-binding SRPBCC domain-containing protein